MNKKLKIILAVVIVLVAVRALLPIVITKYVNKVLAEIPDYKGSIYDVDLNLYRGAYNIDSLKIFKIEGNKEVPFVEVPLIDLSLEWRSLIKGAVVGEVIFNKPRLNFIDSKDDEKDQYGGDVDWTEPIKKLMPLTINRLEIKNGDIRFLNLESKPQVNLYLNQLQLTVNNISNVKGNELLPSDFNLTAKSIGDGDLAIKGKANFIKEMPDLDYDFKFENVKLTALNDFLDAYAKVDAEKGIFFLYHELALQDSNLTGYIKPILNDVKILDLSGEENADNVVRFAWEALVAGFSEIFENQSRDQIATKVTIDGTLEKTDTHIFLAVWNVFKNAFVEALNKQTDGTINLEDAK